MHGAMEGSSPFLHLVAVQARSALALTFAMQILFIYATIKEL
jgi:hypothetical protein